MSPIRPLSKILIGVSFLMLFLTGCSSSKQKLHLFIWSDYISPSVIESFEKQYNCTLVIDTYDTNESMYSKIKTGSTGYDLVFPSDYFISLMQHEGLLEKINTSKIPNLKNLENETLSELNFTLSQVALPYLITFTGLAWNENRVNLVDDSWTVFEDSKYRGRMTMLNDIREAMGAGLLTLGYSINTTNQEEIDQARDLLTVWKKNLAKFESEQYKIGLATNEYFICQGYSSDIAQLNEEITGISFGIPKEGGIVSFDMVAILKGTPNIELAYAFINYLYDPQNAALNIEQTKALAPINKAIDHLDPKYKNNKIIFPPSDVLKSCHAIKDVGNDILLYNRAWDQIKINE